MISRNFNFCFRRRDIIFVLSCTPLASKYIFGAPCVVPPDIRLPPYHSCLTSMWHFHAFALKQCGTFIALRHKFKFSLHCGTYSSRSRRPKHHYVDVVDVLRTPLFPKICESSHHFFVGQVFGSRIILVSRSHYYSGVT